MIANKEFREDLYYRLNVVCIKIPPLNKRKSDITILIDHFIKKYNAENNKNVQSVSSEALDKLMKYAYPGNVRELENIIERAVVLARDIYITKNDLPLQIDSLKVNKVFDPTDLESDYETKLKSF